MKAITVRQPWAWAIAKGYKPVENRSWMRSYRGPLAIHAAKAWDDDAVEAVRFCRDTARAAGHALPERLADDLPYCDTGHVIAIANLTGICSAAFADPGPIRCGCGPWAQPMQNHWLLANVRVLSEPIPMTGSLGLWEADMPADLFEVLV